MIQLAANDWLFDQLMTFDAGSEDLEDGSDAEDDGRIVLPFDRVPAKRSAAGGSSSAAGTSRRSSRRPRRLAPRRHGIARRAVAGQPGAHHLGCPIPAIEKADGDASVVRALAIELTPDLPPER